MFANFSSALIKKWINLTAWLIAYYWLTIKNIKPTYCGWNRSAPARLLSMTSRPFYFAFFKTMWAKTSLMCQSVLVKKNQSLPDFKNNFFVSCVCSPTMHFTADVIFIFAHPHTCTYTIINVICQIKATHRFFRQPSKKYIETITMWVEGH